MKLNLEMQLFGLDGQPATQTEITGYDEKGQAKGIKEVPLTVGLVIRQALNTIKKDSNPSLEDSIKRGKWALAIGRGISPDLKIDDQSYVKKCVNEAGFNPIIVAQMDNYFESKGKSLFEEDMPEQVEGC